MKTIQNLQDGYGIATDRRNPNKVYSYDFNRFNLWGTDRKVVMVTVYRVKEKREIDYNSFDEILAQDLMARPIGLSIW